MTEQNEANAITTSQRPSLLRHVAALVYDTFLVLPMIMVVVAAAMGITAVLSQGEPEPLHPALVQLLAALTVITFYCVFWRKGGQTLGMQAWRIHLVADTGGKPALHSCAVRLLVAPLSLLVLGAGYWWSLFDRHQRYWHDMASQTHLELRPKKP